MTRIADLPTDLQDLVTLFAWGKPATETYLMACVAVEVNRWDIPDIFVKRHHMVWQDMQLQLSPLKVFTANIPPDDWFRQDLCVMMLQLLDFRRRSVKAHGNRNAWMRRLTGNWTSIVPFSSFYLELLCDRDNWKRFGFDTVLTMRTFKECF
jgi:hypothetical protein